MGTDLSFYKERATFRNPDHFIASLMTYKACKRNDTDFIEEYCNHKWESQCNCYETVTHEELKDVFEIMMKTKDEPWADSFAFSEERTIEYIAKLEELIESGDNFTIEWC